MEDKKNNKLYLIGLILTIICLVLLIQLLKKSLSKNEIYDYANMESIVNVMYKGDEVVARATYMTLNDIISNYLDSYIDVNASISDGYKAYYDVLSDSYKDYLSRGQYEKRAVAFLKKFLVGENDIPAMNDVDIIKSIYEVANNEYIVKLDSNFQKEVAYIGIKLKNGNTYEITYIE